MMSRFFNRVVSALALALAGWSPLAWSATPAVAIGNWHACALLAAGTVQCWGTNFGGVLFHAGGAPLYDNGEGGGATRPVEMPGIAGAVSLSVGYQFSCVVLASGSVQCWGNNARGQLGNGTLMDSVTPVTVPGIANAVAVSAGAFHACVLLGDASVRCWGAGDSGQLGDGSMQDRASPVKAIGQRIVKKISAGMGHTCVLREDGKVRCWGRNTDGELGNGGTGPNSLLFQADVENVADAVDLAAGFAQTCALLRNGTVSCWGAVYGEANQNTPPPIRPLPFAVPGVRGATALSSIAATSVCAVVAEGALRCWGETKEMLPLGSDTVGRLRGAVAVSMGWDAGCARMIGGQVQCWGNRGSGVTGRGDDDPSDSVALPQAVPLVGKAIAIGSGSDHACAITDKGQTQCWGNNQSGQVGSGVLDVPYRPNQLQSAIAPVYVNTGGPVARLELKGATSCAYASGGEQVCWGIGSFARDGQGYAATPVFIPRNVPAQHVGAGCETRTDGSLWCAGDIGQRVFNFGLPTVEFSVVQAVEIQGLSGLLKVSATRFQYCGIVKDGGRVRCWDGVTRAVNGQDAVAVGVREVPSLSHAVDIVVTDSQACALDAEGALWCWRGAEQPVRVEGVGKVAQFDMKGEMCQLNQGALVPRCSGVAFSCATLMDGTVRCWGDNRWGQLGDGTRTSRSIAVAVHGLRDVSQVRVGDGFACALLSGGDVRCWGQSGRGQLGGGFPERSYAVGPVVAQSGAGQLNVSAPDGSDIRNVIANRVFEWAEVTFSQYFFGGQTSRSLGGALSRVFADTRSALMVNENGEPHLYYTGPFSNGEVLDLGLLSVWQGEAGF
jgi:alpha-tubulin suppressor-like RCC1 family protein